ncbi:MAG: hypothetical protein JXC36_04805 [Candidatus Atribacteria bacterium]|nr:hypothetical protein [Candidatus Atribacteria bacterium]
MKKIRGKEILPFRSKLPFNLIALFLLLLFLQLSMVGLLGINANASPSPLLNIPLDSWVYADLQQLESMNLLKGIGSIGLYSKPLTRREVAMLINQSLVNIQKEKIDLTETEKVRLEKLVTEFEEELKEFGVRVLPQEVSHQEVLQEYQQDQSIQYISYFIEKGYLQDQSMIYPTPRCQLAEMVSQIIFLLQSGHLTEEKLTETEIEYLKFLVTEFKSELSAYGIQIIYLNKGKTLIHHFKEHFTLSGYLNQFIDLAGEEEWIGDQSHAKEDNHIINFDQGLYEMQLGALLKGEIWDELPFLVDISIDVQVYDLYNLKYSPIELNLNKGYFKFKTDSAHLSISENIPIFSLFDEVEIPGIVWQIGRDELKWGPGHISSLILSDNVSYLDMLKYSGNIDSDQMVGSWGEVYFTKFFSLLDDQRLLFGQRFEYSPETPWRVGLSETAIVKQNCGVLYFNPIPFPLIHYLTQQLYSNISRLSEKENNINYNIGLDLQYQLENGSKFYGEILFDDFIFYQQTNPFPGRYGFILGSNIPDIFSDHKTDLVLEYTRINNYVYFPREEWQSYLFQGEYLGHPLGPDADQLAVKFNYQLNEKADLQLSYIHERHGEGQHGISLPSDPVIANQNQFLSGIIEGSDQFLASLSYDLSEDWQLSLTGSFKNIYNQDNQINQNKRKITLTAEIKFGF